MALWSVKEATGERGCLYLALSGSMSVTRYNLQTYIPSCFFLERKKLTRKVLQKKKKRKKWETKKRMVKETTKKQKPKKKKKKKTVSTIDLPLSGSDSDQTCRWSTRRKLRGQRWSWRHLAGISGKHSKQWSSNERRHTRLFAGKEFQWVTTEAAHFFGIIFFLWSVSPPHPLKRWNWIFFVSILF